MQATRAPGHKWSFSLFISIFPLARLTLIGRPSCLRERRSLWVKTESVTVSLSVAAADVKIYRCSPAVPPHMFHRGSYIRCWCNGGQDPGKRGKQWRDGRLTYWWIFYFYVTIKATGNRSSVKFSFSPLCGSHWPVLRKVSTRLYSSLWRLWTKTFMVKQFYNLVNGCIYITFF